MVSTLHVHSPSIKDNAFPSTPLLRIPYLMNAVAPENQPSCGQKRRREHSTTGATSPQPPWKRAKRPFTSRQEAEASYWNSLSELCLTRRALKELDRRNRHTASPVTTAIIRRPWRSREPVALKNCSNQIKRFARHGGPDLRNLRGCFEPAAANSVAHAMPSSQSTPRTQSKSAKTLGKSTEKTTDRKSSAYHADFEQHLIDHKIYPSDYEFPDNHEGPKPSNWEEINDRLKQPRPSLSPSRFSDRAFKNFVRTNSRARTEAVVMRESFPIISGDDEIPSAGDLPFGNLEPLTDGTLVDPKPDFYDGATPAQIDRRIRTELGSYIIPSTQQHRPALPNFFTEGKGPCGSLDVAKRQACYDGAVGARGVHELRSFGAKGSETLYDNNSYTITSTFHNGNLKLYTVHPVQSTGSKNSPEYHMSQLRSFALTDTAERFREGAGALRNARNWAKQQRNEVIAAANGRVLGMPMETPTSESSSNNTLSQSTNEPVVLDSETSAEEAARDMSEQSRLSHKRLKRGPEKKHCSKLDTKKPPRKRYSAANGRSGSSGDLTS